MNVRYVGVHVSGNKRLVGVLGCLLLTGCGSTLGLQAGGSGGSGLSGSSAPSTSSGGTLGQSNTTGATSGGSSTGGSSGVTLGGSGTSGSTSSGSGATSTSTGGSTTSAGGGQPVNTTTVATAKGAAVAVGVLIYPDVSSFSTELGGQSTSLGNQQTEAQIAFDWVNAHGGLDGHPIKPEYYSVPLTSAQPYDATEQDACTQFTQDDHTVAVIGVGANIDSELPACLNAAHNLYLSGGAYLHDNTDYSQYPYMYSPTEPNTESLARTMVAGILSHGIVKRGGSIGLLAAANEPAGQRATPVVQSLFQAAGVRVVVETVDYPTSTPDLASTEDQIDSDELKMDAQHIQNIMFLCPGCLSTFESSAKSQHYFPRYIISSEDAPGAITGSAYAEEFASALAFGYQPAKDVGTKTHPTALSNSTRTLCEGIEAPSGQDTGDQSDYASEIFCDAVVEIYEAAKEDGSSTVTGTTLARGMGEIGTSFPDALNFTTDITASNHAGVTGYKIMSTLR